MVAGEKQLKPRVAKGSRGHNNSPRLASCIIMWLPVLLLSMVGRVFPFEHGAAFVNTHRVTAASAQHQQRAHCPLRPPTVARVAGSFAGRDARPIAPWEPPAWARPHLKLASGVSSSFTRTSAAAPRRGYKARKRPGLEMRSQHVPVSGWSGGGKRTRSGKGVFKGAARGGYKKKVWGKRSAFPSSKTSTTAPWMAKRATSTATAEDTKTVTKQKASKGGYKLVIVESPAKARTIQKFLDNKFVVESCMGHVRDLPQKARDVPLELKPTYGKLLGVDPDNGFAALYVIMNGKEAVIKRLKDRLKGAAELILASDEDREGEAISWHLLELLKPKVPVKRAVFHEITREAIIRAFEAPRELNYNLVHAQEARRILDRLAGYTMSPLLWRKISPGLSAGRVQSVGLAMIVRRERERLAFKSAEYYDLKANLSTCLGGKAPEARGVTSGGAGAGSSTSTRLTAMLVEVQGRLVASGRDFDSEGQLKQSNSSRAGKTEWLRKEDVEALRARLEMPGTEWRVTRVESKLQRRKPPVPFITSTLQQEANRKLAMSSKECMRVAQSLYEGGWITYMRTDNPILSEAGMTEARKCAESLYGTTNLAMQARAIKKPKGSQEAHEPIRPAITEEGGGGDAGGFNLRPPLQGQQWQLYEMILQRTLASVMVDAQLHLTTVDVAAFTGNKVAAEGGKAATGTPDSVFRTSGTVIKEPGWMRAYEEGTDTAAGGAGGGERTGGGKLPVLEQGQALGCEGISALSHTTRPPARYTEASFVKELEAEGIGRPSTYSQILETLKDRGYVNVEGKAICPSLIAVVVVQLLERHFTEFVDTAFTARMELSLDCIAEGNAAKETYLGEYYLGPQGLRDKVRMSEENILPEEARRALLPMSFDGDDTGFRNVSIFVGPYGAYAQAKVDEATMLKANLPDAVCRDVQLLTPDTIQACLAAKKGPYNGTLLGHEDESGLPILLRVGRFGAYLQVGQGLAVGDGSGVEDADQVKPRTVSLPKNVPLGEVDMALARKFLSLPRVVCVHPETGKDVLAGVGPYGGFVRHSTTYRSLPAADDVLTIGSERALELLAAASKSSVASQTLANIGQLDGKNITVMKGRYGPYIKFGTVNARIPDMYRDMPEETPLAEAIEAILAKADATKGKGASGRRAGSGTGAGGGVKGKDSAKVKGGVASVAKAGIAKKRAVKAGPVRAKPAFLFFCAEKRAELTLKGLGFAEMNKELGIMWKALSDEEQAPYKELSNLDKELKLSQYASSSSGSTPRKLEARTALRTATKKVSTATSKLAKTKKSLKAFGAEPTAKRPRSAYLFFCNSRREDVAKEGLSFGEITKRLSTMWRDLDADERAKFEDMAKEDQARYRREIAV